MEFEPHKPPHPGQLIYEVHIEPFKDVSANKIAGYLDVAPSTFNRLLHGKANITPGMAVRLAGVLGGSATLWMNLQTSYDLCLAKKTMKTKFERFDFEAVA